MNPGDKQPAYKPDRNQQLWDMRQAHPDWTMDKLGKEFGITKQRVGYLLSVMKIRKYGPKKKHIEIGESNVGKR